MLAPRMSCLDLDTFFVSVERLLDPSLRGKPVIVGGTRFGRGVVTSVSYEARGFGVRSGMSIREASERAPANAVFLSGHSEAYGDYSDRARKIVERYSPIVVAASIDEHYLDFRGCERLYRRPGDADDDATILRVVRDMTGAIDRELHRVVVELYREARTRELPIRLLGIALAKLRLDSVQLPLFDAGERRGMAVDRVRDKYGYDAVHLATTLRKRSRR